MTMTLNEAYERAVIEVFTSDDSDFYFSKQTGGTMLNIESGSIPPWNPSTADRWSEVQNLTSQYYGSSIYIEPYNEAQFAAYEVR